MRKKLMKEIEAKAELTSRRPSRGTVKASDREVELDFEQLEVPMPHRDLMPTHFTKKQKKRVQLTTKRKLQVLNREIGGLEAVLGFASFLVKGEGSLVKEEPVVQKRELGRAATHVAIAQYIKYLQHQPSTPSTTS